jgi:hypothetical protein
VVCVHFNVGDVATMAELKHSPLAARHLQHSTAVSCETDSFLILYSIIFQISWLEVFTCKLILWKDLSFIIILDRSQDSVVGIVTGYRLDDWGVRVWVPVGSRIFCSPHRPDWLWGPPNLLYNG